MADKGRLSVEQRIKTVLYFTETRRAVVTQKRFHAHFQIQWAPLFKTIHKHYNQFNNDGSVLERKRRRHSSACSPGNTDTVRVALQRRPAKSTRKATAQLEISRWSVQHRVKSDLNLYPYKMTVLPKLTVQNKCQRMAFAEWTQNNEVSFSSIWFSDEAHFHLDSVVNKQNVRFWASENPRVIHENYSVGCHLKSWTARANFLLRDSEQWALFKHVAHYFCALNFLHDTSNQCVISNRFPNHFACGQNWPRVVMI
jgi:hypothetical protein